MGKGDTRRPENREAFKQGYEKTFGRRPTNEEMQELEARREQFRKKRDEHILDTLTEVPLHLIEEDDDPSDEREADEATTGLTGGFASCSDWAEPTDD